MKGKPYKDEFALTVKKKQYVVDEVSTWKRSRGLQKIPRSTTKKFKMKKAKIHQPKRPKNIGAEIGNPKILRTKQKL